MVLCNSQRALSYCILCKELQILSTGQTFLDRNWSSTSEIVLHSQRTNWPVSTLVGILQGFDFKVDYCPGTRHGNADGMSRIPCHPKQCQCHVKIDELPCGPCNKCLRSSPAVVRVSAVSTRQANLNQLSTEGVSPPRQTNSTSADLEKRIVWASP